MAAVLELQARNEINELIRIQDAVEGFLSANGIGPAQIARIGLIIDEIFSNTVAYGFPEGGSHDLTISLSVGRQEIILVMQDDGIAFNPLELPPPDTSTGLEDRPIGGLGLHLVRNIARGVDYQRQGPYNIMTVSLDRQPRQL